MIKVINLLKKSNKLLINGDFVEGNYKSVGFRTILKVNSFKMSKILIPIILMFIMIKIYLSRRRYKNELKSKAVTINKEILNILNRQLLLSVKSPNCKAYVLEDQE